MSVRHDYSSDPLRTWRCCSQDDDSAEGRIVLEKTALSGQLVGGCEVSGERAQGDKCSMEPGKTI